MRPAGILPDAQPLASPALAEKGRGIIAVVGLADQHARAAISSALPFLGEGHVYQGRFKSFPIQDDAHLLTVLRYVEANPLRRAKLVDRARGLALVKPDLPAFAENQGEAAERRTAGPPAQLAGVGERISGPSGVGGGSSVRRSRPAFWPSPMDDKAGQPPGPAIHNQSAGAAAEKEENMNGFISVETWERTAIKSREDVWIMIVPMLRRSISRYIFSHQSLYLL